jgi:FKBP-type peptidyl-prolyl cis-trans isomerase
MFGRRHFLWSTAVAVVAATAAGCGSNDSDDSPTQPTTPPPQGPATLQITDLVVGEGTEATNGRTAFIAYNLWNFDPNGADQKGTAIPSGTYTWAVGSNQAIAGMNQGVLGMKVGGRRRLVVPPSLAYGSVGSSPYIRPNEWIVFEFELLAVA